jgi:hypothetical protein
VFSENGAAASETFREFFSVGLSGKLLMVLANTVNISARYKRTTMKHAAKNTLGRKPPAKQTIANVVKKLEATGSVLDIHAGGKPPMSEETVADVKQRLEQSSKKSSRRLSQETGLPYSTCQRAPKKAKSKAYRVTVVQELKPLDA